MSLPLATEHRLRVEEFQRKHRIGLLTLLFTDIVGSTQLKQTLGDREAVILIQQHHAAIREILSSFKDGQEIDTAGDSFFIVFAKPSDAVRFSLLIQARLNKLARESGHCIFDRIGIHVGEVFMEEREGSRKPLDLYGIQVDSTARVMSLALSRQILMTRFAFDNARQVFKGQDIPGVGALSWLNHGPFLMKGIDEPIEICEVGEDGDAPLSAPPDSEKARRHIPAGAEPVLGWRPAVGLVIPNTQWTLDRKLGEGGFGEVWLGHHAALKEKRVFKFCFQADRVRSLKREVTLFRLLRESVGHHPNIVGIQDVYLDDPPPFYLVMDFAEGEDLVRWFEHQGGSQKIAIGILLEIVAQIADALQAAHEAGIIHRDVKPSNVIVSQPQGMAQAKLTDFGIGEVVSKEALIGVTQSGFTQTIAGRMDSGTLLYMAPELISGKAASTRSDIYSLGVVLYQLLVGDLTRAITVDWSRDIEDPLLREDLAKCLAGKPQERFASAHSLAQKLRNLPARREEQAKREAELSLRERVAFRNGVLRTLSGAVIVLLIISGLALYARREYNRTRVTLSDSLFWQGARLVENDNRDDALAYLAQSLCENPNNHAAFTRLITLLTYHSWMVASTVSEHGDVVASVQFSPDGKRFVTASWDATACVWDATTGQRLLEPLKHDQPLWTAQFSPDARHIVTASADGTARIWDAQTGKELRRLQHDLLVWTAEFSPDGALILTASDDHTARLWNAQTGQELRRFTHKGAVLSAHFNHDGNRILTASADDTARLWNAQTGQEMLAKPFEYGGKVPAQFSPDGKSILTVSWMILNLWNATDGTRISQVKQETNLRMAEFSPDGLRVITACDDKTARLWDVKTGRLLLEPFKHAAPVWSARFNSDGKQVATTSMDGKVRVWNTHTGQPLTEPLKHGNLVRNARFSPDDSRLITVSDDRCVRIWSRVSGNALAQPLDEDQPVQWIQYSPGGKWIVTSSRQGKTVIWDAHTGKILVNLTGNTDEVNTVYFNSDELRVVTAGKDGTAGVWDVRTGKNLFILTGHQKEITSARFSPDGTLVVTASRDHTARIWDAHTGQLRHVLSHDGAVNSARFSVDGKQVVTASDDKRACIWDAQTGNQLKQLLGHGNTVLGAEFSPDRKYVLTASRDDTARIWNAETGVLLTRPLKHSETVRTAHFNGQGNQVVTASIDGTARVWNVNTGLPVTDPLKHSKAVVLAEFSHDDMRILTASEDGIARIWDLQSGLPLTEPLQHEKSILLAQFSPDGERIAVASADYGARIWDVAPLPQKCPPAILQLAEAISGQTVKKGTLQMISQNRTDTLNLLRQQFKDNPADHSMLWGQWILSNPGTRSISPLSQIKPSDYLEQCLKHPSFFRLDEAEPLADGNPSMLQRITQARKALNAAKSAQ